MTCDGVLEASTQFAATWQQHSSRMAGIDMKYGINTRVRGIGLEFSAGTSYRDEADCGCSSLAWPGPLSNAPGPLTRGQAGWSNFLQVPAK